MKQKFNWQQNIVITPIQNSQNEFPEDWFAIFFCEQMSQLRHIYLKPLHEKVNDSFLEEEGVMLAFQRSLIEEDDKEYALEVLNLFNLTPNHCLQISPSFQERLKLSISLLQKELAEPSDHYILVKTLLKVLLLQLIKLQHSGFISYELNQKRVYMFLKLMEQHYIVKTKAEYYASAIGISEKRLNQILKEKLNKTAKQIIQQRQLTEIKRMLQIDELSLKEIAFQLNFQSVSNFSRFFKRHTAMSPSEYKIYLSTKRIE